MIRALCAVLVLTIAGACAPAKREALTVYSGRAENLIRPLLEKFSRQEGVPIDVRYGTSSELALLVDEEGNRTPADVFLSQSPGAVGYLASRTRLAKLGQSTLNLENPAYRSASGRWIAASGRQRVLVYDTRVVQPAQLPASVFDLTDPRYKGQVAVAPQNASFQDFVTAMSTIAGEAKTAEWLSGMKGNETKTYPNNNAIVDAVARGEVRMGLVNHYYNLQHLHEDPDLPTRNYQFPASDLGSLVLVSTASVLRASDAKGDAEKLVRFLLKRESQRYFVEETFEYPVIEGVDPPGGLRPLAQVASIPYAFDSLGAHLKETTDLIARSGF